MFNFKSLFLRFISLILGLSNSQSFPPPLSHSEEVELFRKMREEKDQSARAKLIEHNLRLVSHIIRKYYSSYKDEDELLSIGSFGLIKAVDSFKSELGTRFATYGAKCIQNEILMFFRSQKKTSSEVSISETIDTDKDGNPLTYIDVISIDDTIAEDLDFKLQAEKALRLVTTELLPREKEIIIMRYGLGNDPPRTQREVAKYLNISRSYVSRIEKKALSILRKHFGDTSPTYLSEKE